MRISIIKTIFFPFMKYCINVLQLIAVFFGFSVPVLGQYTSPASYKVLTLDSLVALSSGVVVQNNGIYQINQDITINYLDTLLIKEPATILVATGKKILINGVIISAPLNGRVVFSAIDTSSTSSYFKGFKISNSSASVFKNTTIMYGGGIHVLDSDMLFDSCLIRNNGYSNVNAAITYVNCNPIIRNCIFKDNKRAAIGSGSNVTGSPQIFNNIFIHNTADISNRPQLNLGQGGEDTIRIVGNYIEGYWPRSGGIIVTTYFGGSAKVLLKDNEIRNNRYGYSQTGGNISSLIINNLIVANDLETNIMQGGAGLDFSATTASGNMAVVRGNTIYDNLWGITVQGVANADLGTEESPGHNLIYNNGNGGELFNVYMTSVNNVNAINNFWGSESELEIEDMVYHGIDEPGFGMVDFTPFWTISPEIDAFFFPESLNEQFDDDIRGVIDPVSHTISVTVPFGTDLTNLVPVVCIQEGRSVFPVSGVPQDFSVNVIYTVTTPLTQQEWTIIVEEGQVYSVKFNIVDQEQNLLEDAIVQFNGDAYLPGHYEFINLEPDVYSYSITKSGYETETGEVILEDENLVIPIELSRIWFNLKFTIKDQENNAVSNALIQIGNNSILTDSQGEASICLLSGEFDYRVLKDGYLEYAGIVVISEEDEAEYVALVPNGLKELGSSTFLVYPNPFNNVIVIKEPDKVQKVNIANLDGRLVSELQTEGAAIIETSFIPRGIYIVTVVGKDQSIKSFILTKQ